MNAVYAFVMAPTRNINASAESRKQAREQIDAALLAPLPAETGIATPATPASDSRMFDDDEAWASMAHLANRTE